MARPKYIIQEHDCLYAVNYLLNRCRLNDDYLDRGAMTTPVFLTKLEDMATSDDLEFDAYRLNRLCEKSLSKKQWNDMKTSIRKSRSRDVSDTIQVTMTRQAHDALVAISKRDNVTLSDAVLIMSKSLSYKKKNSTE
jgi:hypothetical protein